MKPIETYRNGLPPALEKIAGSRDHISTAEFARYITHASQTIRKNYCLTGKAFGVRPTKLGGRLLWPVHDIAQLLIDDAPCVKANHDSTGRLA
jgi:hypothetical protein